MNLTRLPPGSWSSKLHRHARRNQPGNVLSGGGVLVADEGEQVLEGGARLTRLGATPSEAALWRELRGGRLGVVFRRQVPLLGRYVADFCASAACVVVDVDGPWHGPRERATRGGTRRSGGRGTGCCGCPQRSWSGT